LRGIGRRWDLKEIATCQEFNCFVFLFLEKVVFGWCIIGIKERVGDDVILRGERETGRELEKGIRPRFQPRVGRVGVKERKKRKETKKFKEQLSECYNVT
jgi:hypothetical protein